MIEHLIVFTSLGTAVLGLIYIMGLIVLDHIKERKRDTSER